MNSVIPFKNYLITDLEVSDLNCELLDRYAGIEDSKIPHIHQDDVHKIYFSLITSLTYLKRVNYFEDSLNDDEETFSRNVARTKIDLEITLLFESLFEAMDILKHIKDRQIKLLQEVSPNIRSELVAELDSLYASLVENKNLAHMSKRHSFMYNYIFWTHDFSGRKHISFYENSINRPIPLVDMVFRSIKYIVEQMESYVKQVSSRL